MNTNEHGFRRTGLAAGVGLPHRVVPILTLTAVAERHIPIKKAPNRRTYVCTVSKGSVELKPVVLVRTAVNKPFVARPAAQDVKKCYPSVGPEGATDADALSARRAVLAHELILLRASSPGERI